MANIFGINIETPEEQQRRILEEQAVASKQFQGNRNSQFAFNLANALSQSFGGLKKKREMAEARQDAIAQGQKVKAGHIAAGTDPFQAEIAARAAAVAHLRALGGAENVALANQLLDSTSELLRAKRAEDQRMNTLKAQERSANVSADATEQSTFLQRTPDQLQAEVEENNARLATFGPDDPNRVALQRRNDVLFGRIAELEKEEQEKKEYVFTEQYTRLPDGTTGKQRVAVNKNNPREVVTLGVAQETLPEMSAAAEKEMMTAQNNYLQSQGSVENMSTLVVDIPQNLSSEGKAAELKERAKALAGTEDIETVIRQRVQQIRISQAIKNLPPGVASDKDIELVLSGTIPSTANPDALIAYIENLARVEAAVANYNRFKAEYMSEHGNSRGMLKAWNDRDKSGDITVNFSSQPSVPAPTPQNPAASQPTIVSITEVP